VGDECNGRCFGNLYCNDNQCARLAQINEPCSPNDVGPRCDSIANVCGSNNTCLPRIPVGSACGGPAGGSCALGSFCGDQINQIPSNCTLPLGVGEPCYSGRHCESTFCEFDVIGGEGSCQEYKACWE
jgi:hypothetical protein